jgi:hypothetical protein
MNFLHEFVAALPVTSKQTRIGHFLLFFPRNLKSVISPQAYHSKSSKRADIYKYLFCLSLYRVHRGGKKIRHFWPMRKI